MEELFSKVYNNDQEGFISEYKRQSNEIKPAVESLITDVLSNSEPLNVEVDYIKSIDPPFIEGFF